MSLVETTEPQGSRASQPEWLNNTVNIDTGAIFGGALTALRYPGREFVSISADREYSVPIRPITIPAAESHSSQQVLDHVVDLEDVTRKRIIETRLHRTITSAVHVDRTNLWHMETLHRFAAADPDFILATPFLELDVANKSACQWW
jgi:protein phosphatase